MFWPSKKAVKKEFSKIAQSFLKRDLKIQELREDLVPRKEIELMIENAALKAKPQLREHARTTPRTNKRKKADRLLDKAEICSEIGSLLQKGLSTTEIQHDIVEKRALCKKTCFYKYLRLVREATPRTTRTIRAK